MGCFYCDEHHEGREAIMFKVGEMKAGVLYLFKDQAHKGRCALALKAHKKEKPEPATFHKTLGEQATPHEVDTEPPPGCYDISERGKNEEALTGTDV